MLTGLLPKLVTADAVLLGGCGHSVCAEQPGSIARLIHHLLEEAALS
jgi:hypothetical protein